MNSIIQSLKEKISYKKEGVTVISAIVGGLYLIIFFSLLVGEYGNGEQLMGNGSISNFLILNLTIYFLSFFWLQYYVSVGNDSYLKTHEKNVMKVSYTPFLNTSYTFTMLVLITIKDGAMFIYNEMDNFIEVNYEFLKDINKD